MQKGWLFDGGRFPGLYPGWTVRGTALANDQDFLKVLGAENGGKQFASVFLCADLRKNDRDS